MTVHTSAGSKIFIGGVAASTVDTQAEYEALSLVEIGEVEDLGEFGDSVSPITFTPLSTRRVNKFKGSFDAGNITLNLGRDVTNAGQLALRNALASDFDYAFKVTLNDAGAGSPGDTTKIYFRGKVMSFTTNVSNVDSITRASVSIAINSEILEVVAA